MGIRFAMLGALYRRLRSVERLTRNNGAGCIRIGRQTICNCDAYQTDYTSEQTSPLQLCKARLTNLSKSTLRIPIFPKMFKPIDVDRVPSYFRFYTISNEEKFVTFDQISTIIHMHFTNFIFKSISFFK